MEIDNLTVFSISSSQLGAKEKDIANSIELMSGPKVFHYWDGEQTVGAAVQRYLPDLDYPAWDFWMLYAPGVIWGEAFPEPAWWEHQLMSLERDYSERSLDAKRFARKAAEIIGRVQSANER